MPGSFVATTFLAAPDDARVDRCAEEWEADLDALSAKAFAKKHGGEAIALVQKGVALLERRAFAGDPAKMTACVRGTALGLQTLQRIASALAFKPLTLEFFRLKLAAALLDADMVSEAVRQLDSVAGSLSDAYLERGSSSSPAALPAPPKGKAAPRLGLAGVLWHHTAARVCLAANSEPLLAEAVRAIAGGSVAAWLARLAAEGTPQQGQQGAAKYAASFRALASALWREARHRAPHLVPLAATAYTASLLFVAAAAGAAGQHDSSDAAPDSLHGALSAMGDAQDSLLSDRSLSPLATAPRTAVAGAQRSAAKAGVASSLHALAALECAAAGDSAAARLRAAASRAAATLSRPAARGGGENGPVQHSLVEWVEARRPATGAEAPALASSSALLDAIVDAASSSPWQPLCDGPFAAPLLVSAMSRAARLLACLGRSEKECGKPIQLARLALRTASEGGDGPTIGPLALSVAKTAAYAAWAAVGASCAEAAAAAAENADPDAKAWRRSASQGEGAAHVRTLVHRVAALAEEAAGHASSLQGDTGRPCTPALTQALAALRDVLQWAEPCTRTLLAVTHTVFDPGALPPVLAPHQSQGASGAARADPTATPAPSHARTASRVSHTPATPAPPVSAARSRRGSQARGGNPPAGGIDAEGEEDEEEEDEEGHARPHPSTTPAPKARSAPREARDALGAFDALLSVGERAILGLVRALDAVEGGGARGWSQCGPLLRDAARLRLRLRLLPALSECAGEGDVVTARHTAAYATLCAKAAATTVAAAVAVAGEDCSDSPAPHSLQHARALEHAMANDATALYRDGRPGLAAVPAAVAATLACLRCAVAASGAPRDEGADSAAGLIEAMDAAAARLELAALCASKAADGQRGGSHAAYAVAAALHAAAHAVRRPAEEDVEVVAAGRLLGQAACQALTASLAAAPPSLSRGDEGALAPLPALVLQRLMPSCACRGADSDSNAAWTSAVEELERQCRRAPAPRTAAGASVFGSALALVAEAHPALHPRWAAACCCAASAAALARAAAEGSAGVEATSRALTRAHPTGVPLDDLSSALEQVAPEGATATRAAAAAHCWREARLLWADRHAVALGGDRWLARRLADTVAAVHALSLGQALAVTARLRGVDCLPPAYHRVLSPSPASRQQPSSLGATAAAAAAESATPPSMADALAALEGVGEALLHSTVPFLASGGDSDTDCGREEEEGGGPAAVVAEAVAHCAALLREGEASGRTALAVAAVAGAVAGAVGDEATAAAARAVAEAAAEGEGLSLGARDKGAARKGRGRGRGGGNTGALAPWCEQAWSEGRGEAALSEVAAAATAWREDRYAQEPLLELMALLASRVSATAAAKGQVHTAVLAARLARAAVAPARGWEGVAARLMVPAAALEPAQALAHLVEGAGGPDALPDSPSDGGGAGARVALLRQQLHTVLGAAGEPLSERLPWVLAQAAVVAELPEVGAGGSDAEAQTQAGPDSAWTPFRALSSVTGGTQRAAAWQRLLAAGQASTSGPDRDLGRLVALLLSHSPAFDHDGPGQCEGEEPGASLLQSAGVTFTAAQGRRARAQASSCRAAAVEEEDNGDEQESVSSREASPVKTGTRRALFADQGAVSPSAAPATPCVPAAQSTPGSALGGGLATGGSTVVLGEAAEGGAPSLDAADSARVLDILAALSATTAPEWGGSVAAATSLGAAAARAWHTALVRPTWAGVGAGAAGHSVSLAHAFTAVAHLWHVRGDADRALFYASQGLVVASACGDLLATTAALSRLALTSADAGLARLAAQASEQCAEMVGLPSEASAVATTQPALPAIAAAQACLARGVAATQPDSGDGDGDAWIRAARDIALGSQGVGVGGVDAAIRAVGLTRVGVAAEACARLVAQPPSCGSVLSADEVGVARALATTLPSPSAHDLSAALILRGEQAGALAAAAQVMAAHARGATVSARAVRVAGRHLAVWGGGDAWERLWCLAASIGPSHWLACARALGTRCGQAWPRVADAAGGLLAACATAGDGLESGLASALEALTLEEEESVGGARAMATPSRGGRGARREETVGLAALCDPRVALAALLPGAYVPSVPRDALWARAGVLAGTVGAWLPAHWTMVLLASAPDGALLIGGVQASSAPYVVRVSAGGCAPVEETAQLLEEAEEHARAAAPRARALSSAEKRHWWAARHTADEKLARLLRRTQRQWLGPWRALLMPTGDDSACEGEEVDSKAVAVEALRCAGPREDVDQCTVAAATQVVRCMRQGRVSAEEGVCAVLALAGRLPVASPAAMAKSLREDWDALAGVVDSIYSVLAPGGDQEAAAKAEEVEVEVEVEKASNTAGSARSVDAIAAELGGWKVVELKAALGDRALRKSGRKAELVARLAEAMAEEEEEEEDKEEGEDKKETHEPTQSAAGRASAGTPALDELLKALEGEEKEEEEGAGLSPSPTGPAVLVVDEALQRFPWESLPCLADADVTRLSAAPLILGPEALSGRDAATTPAPPRSPMASSAAAPSTTASVDGVRAAARAETGGSLLARSERPQRVRQAVTVVNPGGDLKSTETTLGPTLAECMGRGAVPGAWTAVAGRAPTEGEMESGVHGEGRVLVYCGHGTGGQYLSRARVERAVGDGTALLLGCSSARLRRAGDFDAAGAAVSHLLAGRSAVLGCLWDVTDGDLDRYSAAFLRRWWSGDAETGGSLCVSNREARAACKLRWLVGAAPVVYGLPVGPAQWCADGEDEAEGAATLDAGPSGAKGAGAAAGGPPASCLKTRERRRRPRGSTARPDAGSRRALAVRFAMMEE